MNVDECFMTFRNHHHEDPREDFLMLYISSLDIQMAKGDRSRFRHSPSFSQSCAQIKYSSYIK